MRRCRWRRRDPCPRDNSEWSPSMSANICSSIPIASMRWSRRWTWCANSRRRRNYALSRLELFSRCPPLPMRRSLRRTEVHFRRRATNGAACASAPCSPDTTRSNLATGKTDVYANYYDASESDLTALSAPPSPAPMKSASAVESVSSPKQVQPLSATADRIRGDCDPARIRAAAANRQSMEDAACLSVLSCCGCCLRRR